MIVERGDDHLEMYMLAKAVRVVREENKASPTMLQRRMKIGFALAATYIELMERAGLCDPITRLPRAIYLDGVSDNQAAKMMLDRWAERKPNN